eukprot:Sspe_Gene.107358::Locus_85469_Transcript_1_1_Confidence_1.000_Length_956::g.107358::m.107358/K14165/K14165; atypical dual specificity phosphatase
MKIRPKGRRPAMSLTSLHLDGEIPPFFSFVVEKKLAACGDFDHDKLTDQLRNLSKRQIGGVISLTEQCVAEDVFHQSSMKLLHLPTKDLTPPSVPDLRKGVHFIEQLNQDNKAVLVHCAQGIGRTGTMLGAYFIIKERMPARDAIETVRERRAGSIHKKAQEDQLYHLELEVLGTSSRPADYDEHFDLFGPRQGDGGEDGEDPPPPNPPHDVPPTPSARGNRGLPLLHEDDPASS